MFACVTTACFQQHSSLTSTCIYTIQNCSVRVWVWAWTWTLRGCCWNRLRNSNFLAVRQAAVFTTCFTVRKQPAPRAFTGWNYIYANATALATMYRLYGRRHAIITRQLWQRMHLTVMRHGLLHWRHHWFPKQPPQRLRVVWVDAASVEFVSIWNKKSKSNKTNHHAFTHNNK